MELERLKSELGHKSYETYKFLGYLGSFLYLKLSSRGLNAKSRDLDVRFSLCLGRAGWFNKTAESLL
jgi:hypothetical protein